MDAEHTKEIISKLLGEMNKLRAYWMQEMQLRHCCQNEVFEYKHMVRDKQHFDIQTCPIIMPIFSRLLVWMPLQIESWRNWNIIEHSQPGNSNNTVL